VAASLSHGLPALLATAHRGAACFAQVVYERYEAFRDAILRDILAHVGKSATSKRVVLADDAVSGLQMSTTVVLLLAQATAARPSAAFVQSLPATLSGGDGEDVLERRMTVDGAHDGYKDCLLRVMASFLKPFVERCVQQQEE
jgi:hypothetical protein